MESASLDRYKKEKKVGEGTYGVVYKAHDRETGNVSIAILEFLIIVQLLTSSFRL